MWYFGWFWGLLCSAGNPPWQRTPVAKKKSNPPLLPSPPARKQAAAFTSRRAPLEVERRLATRRAALHLHAAPASAPSRRLASKPRRAPLPSRVPPRRPRVQSVPVPPRLQSAPLPPRLQSAPVPPRLQSAPVPHRLQAARGAASASTSGRIKPGATFTSLVRMDNSDTLAVRFHFGGSFQSIDGLILYVGGDIGMSYIELNKISLPEIKGHLEDHFKIDNVVRMHWLKPGKELSNGLVLLVDDASCQLMADGTSYAKIADIYAEELGVQKMQQWSVDEEEQCAHGDEEWLYNSHEITAVEEDGSDREQEEAGKEECYSIEEEYNVVESDDSSDEDYLQLHSWAHSHLSTFMLPEWYNSLQKIHQLAKLDQVKQHQARLKQGEQGEEARLQ
ncbi:uncharacterized protein [Miscanthus floridulus]|uniref:uncharacterized protein n=1 Tax=Miscanthus floridulus TaxID=154761 RepID=UPI003457FD81